MALIVQDNTGLVANANGYISVAYFKTYFADRNIDVSDFDDDQIAGAIVAASDYIDLKTFRGEILEDAQTTAFPRYRLTDSRGVLIEGIPTNLKKATAEYARQACINGGELIPALEASATGQLVTAKREKVGPIEEETTYSATASNFRAYPMADRLLAPYMNGGFLTVYRA